MPSGVGQRSILTGKRYEHAPRRVWGLALALACLLALAGLSSESANAATGRVDLHKPSLARAGAAAGTHWACPTGACDAIVVPKAGKASSSGGHGISDGSGERKGLDPQDLESAYAIPSTLETPQTIALVDAFGYPGAESDLATYRERYGLPPCTKANGCFKKVNEKGKEGDYPPEEEGWDVEAALDEDMASAACPQCHILLVEGSGELPAELSTAVDTAAKLGATEISNSYGYPEAFKEFCGNSECSQYEKSYEHPGVLITAASGDAGYDDVYFELDSTDFPASSPAVVAVGGTALFKVPSAPRGWAEEVWNEPDLAIGTGSGCTTKPKPAWQSDQGCHGRTDNDVAAVAAVVTPVSIRFDGIWTLVGGTSVASPLVAGIEAHASSHTRSLGARAFYEDPLSLNDITEGFDWNALDESGTSECASEEYLCNAVIGYDGPTGLGTPAGVPGVFEEPVVKRIAPRRGPVKGGTNVKITGTSLGGATEVAFGSTPASSFTVNSPTSITAVAPAASGPGSVEVTVVTPGGSSAEGRAQKYTYKGKA